MSRAELVSRRLQADDDLASFDSGQSALDEWLRCSAAHADAMRTARTFIWEQRGAVIAYFSLAGHVLEREALPRPLARGSPDRVPAVLIARLALHRDLHGPGLGGLLLADAVERVAAATEIVAARFVVVDAIDNQAASFYVHFGFRTIPGSGRLVRKVSDIVGDMQSGSQ